MRRELMSREEVDSQLRLHGITDIAEVKRAYLEPNGTISIIAFDDAKAEDPPATPAL